MNQVHDDKASEQEPKTVKGQCPRHGEVEAKLIAFGGGHVALCPCKDHEGKDCGRIVYNGE